MKYFFTFLFFLGASTTLFSSEPHLIGAPQPLAADIDAQAKHKSAEEEVQQSQPVNHFEAYAGPLPQSFRELYNDWREPEETYRKLGTSKPRTAIVHGPDGTGKTTLITCMARAIGAHLVPIKSPLQLVCIAVDQPDMPFQQLIQDYNLTAYGYKEGDCIIAYLPNAERLLCSKVPFAPCPYKALTNMVLKSPNTLLIAETSKKLGQPILKRFDSIVPIESPTPAHRTAILTHYLEKTTVPKNLTVKNIQQAAHYLSAQLPNAAGADIEKIVSKCIRTAHASKKTLDENALQASTRRYKKLLSGSIQSDHKPEASFMFS